MAPFKTMLICMACTLGTLVYAFNTLHDIQAFTREHPEYPDNDQILLTVSTPTEITFDTFFREQRPTIWQRIKRLIGLAPSFWNAAHFDARLQRVMLQESDRLQKKLPTHTEAQSTNHVMITARITLENEPLQYILFGSLTGSVHALCRMLEQLVAHQLLDTNLVIQSPNVQILFLGDIIGASPYNLEIFDVILLLLERNPGNVTYLRGWSETNQRWQSLPLLSELKIKEQITGTQLQSLCKRIDDFLYALPAAYLITDSSATEALLCATKEVREALSSTQLAQCVRLQPATPSDPFNVCAILTETPSELPSALTIYATLSTTIFGDTYYPMSLFHTFLPKGTTPVWHLISGASGIYRAIYRAQDEGYFTLNFSPTDFTRSTLSVTKRSLLTLNAPFVTAESLPIVDRLKTLGEA